jgi:hypothetical protein
MASAKKINCLVVTAGDKPGLMAEVSDSVSKAGVNIEAICAYHVGKEAIFLMSCSDNAKATEVLTGKGYDVESAEMVSVSLENKVGALAEISGKLKEKNVNLKRCFGAVCDCDCPCVLILQGDNNDQVVSALS